MEGAPLPPTRRERRASLIDRPPLVVVIGGGVTGAGVALDLTLRGVRTLLVERGDWAEATSSSSSRLLHGGLRYLEQYHFGMVRESCIERARLLRNAAGLAWPERFLFPLRRGDRVGRLKLGAGLLLYTALSLPRPLGMPALRGREEVERSLPGIDATGLLGAGEYLDGATDDARLTLAIVQSAVDAGAVALSRTEAIAVEQGTGGAEVGLRDGLTGAETSIRCRAVVLAGGPFTDPLRRRAGLLGGWISATRGAHVLVPRERLPIDGATIFASRVDGRVMFFLPWPRWTAIGTTDLDAEADDPVRATHPEVRYLLDSANGLVPEANLTEDDVVSTWAGLRPLLAAPGKDPSARSREERLERDGAIYTLAGGKLTAYRSMAEKLSARLTADIGIGLRGRRSPTRNHRLRGALDAPVPRPHWSRLNGAEHVPRGEQALEVAWGKRYGSLRPDVAAMCGYVMDGAQPLDPETLLGELDWAIQREDCLHPSDFFLRRTDLGYGPRTAVEACVEPVLARMSERLGWSEATHARAAAELRAGLADLHAWRDG